MSRFRDGAEIRRQRIQRLVELIRNNDLPQEKLEGLFMLQTGLTRPKIQEYILDLELTGLIERKEGKIKVLI